MSQPQRFPLPLLHRTSGESGRVERLGPYAIESLIERDEEGAGTVYRVQIAPHERTRISYHRVAEEYYYVLAGRGRAILGGQEYRLTVGDFLRLPPGMTHGFVTDDEPLDLLNIHTPGCRPDRDTYFADGPAPDGFGPA
jgi:quercetin dioxygenase-like cupin family protein